MNSNDPFLQAAIEEARQGLAEGGIPIGSVIVHGDKIIGRGHNRRVQKGSSILHGEMDALENAGRQSAAVYRECVLYTTLSPCSMCSGAILLYGIPRVIIGENKTFMGEEELLRSRGVAIEVVQSDECIRMMEEFIRKNPKLWNEDIGFKIPNDQYAAFRITFEFSTTIVSVRFISRENFFCNGLLFLLDQVDILCFIEAGYSNRENPIFFF